jgi:hypothetical protein
VANAAELVREAIGFLLLAADPRHTVVWEADEHPDTTWRVGIVISDAHPAEAVFRNQPEVLLSLSHGTHTFPPYTTPQHIAHVLRHAEIGLEDLDLESETDRDMVERILSITSGLAAQVRSLVQLVELVARNSGIKRPTLACVEAAARVIPKLVSRTESAHPFIPDEVVHDLVVRPPPRRRSTLSGSNEATGESAVTTKRKKTRAEHLKEKREGRALAEAEGRDIRRHRNRG